MIVYGTVLPWANEKGDDGQAAMWQVHYEQIEQQAEHWRTLRELHPEAPLIVAGASTRTVTGRAGTAPAAAASCSPRPCMMRTWSV